MGQRVILYRAPTTQADTDELADWLQPRIDRDVEIRPRFLDGHRDEALPEEFARTRVLAPFDRETGNTMLGIVRYEERALANPERAGGVLYDGNAVQRALNARLPSTESSLASLHVILLDRVLATWGADGRWHKRVNILGQPALLSVPGLYEAPAKPEAYYKEQQRHALLSGDSPPREVLESTVEGDFLVEDDPRTTDALKGCVLQAVHLVDHGRAFCDTEHCRLFNAHYQADLITAQLRDPEFCDHHAAQYT